MVQQMKSHLAASLLAKQKDPVCIASQGREEREDSILSSLCLLGFLGHHVHVLRMQPPLNSQSSYSGLDSSSSLRQNPATQGLDLFIFETKLHGLYGS